MTDNVSSSPHPSELNRLYALYNHGDLLGAENFCRNLLKNYRGSAELSNMLGVILAAQGKSEEALLVFKDTIKENPKYPRVHLDLGLLLSSIGQPSEAIDSFRRATELDPGNGDAQNNLGVMLQNQNHHEKALPHLEKAIILNSNNSAAYFNCANSLKAVGKNEEALEKYNQAVRLQPSFPVAFNNRGNLLESMGRNEDAKRSYSRAIELDRGYVRAYSNRGIVEKKLGNYPGALRDFSKAVELDPWQPNSSNQDENFKFRLYINLGDIHLYFKEFDKALSAYDRAGEIEPANKDLLGFKSNAVAGMGDIEEALKLRQVSYGFISFSLSEGVSITHGST